MNILRRIRKAFWRWQDERRKRRLQSIVMEASKIAAVKMKHGRSSDLVIRQQQAMTQLLRGGR